MKILQDFRKKNFICRVVTNNDRKNSPQGNGYHKIKKVAAVALAILTLPCGMQAASATPDTVATRHSLSGGVTLPTLDVYAPRRAFDIHDSQMSAVELSARQIKSTPSLFGEPDVMKALQKLPGVQSGADGSAAIFVRGGDYDQNLITLDGSTLYNSEHLKGFVSAINPDMVQNVLFFKGAFPARYGARLSSVIDVGIKSGDFNTYHGELSLGLLSSRFRVEGPIVRGTTSFNVSGRISYFNLIVEPSLRKVYTGNNALGNYSQMNFYDLNAKIVHRFSPVDRLSAVFYMGHDTNNSAPSTSRSTSTQSTVSGYQVYNDNSKTLIDSRTDNTWGNVVSSLYWTHQPSARLDWNLNLSYSRYRYQLANTSDEASNITRQEESKLLYDYTGHTAQTYHSSIDDVALTFDSHFKAGHGHDLRGGFKVSRQQLNPTIDISRYARTIRFINTPDPLTQLVVGRYDTLAVMRDTTLGKRAHLLTAAVYCEDDYTLSPSIRANVGLRYEAFATHASTYHSLEPRLSLRWLFIRSMALKLSYSRMAQGIHLLSSNNIVMPSDIWVPASQSIPLMKSDQFASAIDWKPCPGIDVSVEGYYKNTDNVIEYAGGNTYADATGTWENLVVLGKGRSYGIEFLLQKSLGTTTGWLSYTWSKSLRTFDRQAQELNGGAEFYASNDRRHNLNLVVDHKFNRHWSISASWSYQTGRRGTIPLYLIYSPSIDFYDSYMTITSSYFSYGEILRGVNDVSFFEKFLRRYTYRNRNDYKLPDTHHLDVSVTYTIKHRVGVSSINLSIYNLYNRMNFTNVYVGTDKGQTVLKGICPFPFMPSLSYTFRF